MAVYDACVIVANQTDVPEDGFEILRHHVRNNPGLYQDAMVRMQERESVFTDWIEQYEEASFIEKVEHSSRVVTQLFAPGYFIKGVASASRSVSSWKKFGTFSEPPLFRNVHNDAPLPLSEVKKFTITVADIQENIGKQTYLYVITEDNVLTIAPHDIGLMVVERRPGFITNILHHHDLAQLKPVYAAGTLSTNSGLITSITLMSGHYLPTGRHLKSLIETAFTRYGFRDIEGKYHGFSMHHIISQKPDILYAPPALSHSTQHFIAYLNSVVITNDALAKEMGVRPSIWGELCHTLKRLEPAPTDSVIIEAHGIEQRHELAVVFDKLKNLWEGFKQDMREEGSISAAVKKHLPANTHENLTVMEFLKRIDYNYLPKSASAIRTAEAIFGEIQDNPLRHKHPALTLLSHASYVSDERPSSVFKEARVELLDTVLNNNEVFMQEKAEQLSTPVNNDCFTKDQLEQFELMKACSLHMQSTPFKAVIGDHKLTALQCRLDNIQRETGLDWRGMQKHLADHQVAVFDINDHKVRELILTEIVSHNDASHLKHLPTALYAEVIAKKIERIKASREAQGLVDVADDKANIFSKIFSKARKVVGIAELFCVSFMPNVSAISKEDVEANPGYWQTTESLKTPKYPYFTPEAEAQASFYWGQKQRIQDEHSSSTVSI